MKSHATPSRHPKRPISPHYFDAPCLTGANLCCRWRPEAEPIDPRYAHDRRDDVVSFKTEIFGEGETADYAYQVVSGGVRTYKVLSDGRRQVSGFYLPGDVFGLEFRDEHTLSAEAISDTKVVVVKRSMLMALAGRDPGISCELLALTGSELRRVQTRMLLG